MNPRLAGGTRALALAIGATRALGATRVLAAAILLSAGAGVAAAQTGGPGDTTLFAALKWREIGPYRGGRSVAVAGSAARPNEYWMGTTGGGVFKTTDGGLTWAPASDKYFGGTIGAIAVSASNPDIVYVGTGEYPIRGNVSHGDGVYRTDDGGKTWRYLGLVETRQIGKIQVHPTNPNVVYVAALGHAWGPNPERGVYRSGDGGKAWKKILFRNDSTGAVDLAMDPSNPAVLYAAFWQAGRKPWQMVSGGAGSGIFKSTDGGETWTDLTRKPGLPKGILGNIGVSVSPAKPSQVWAMVEADSGGVFRSADGGEHWERTNQERKLRQRAWYYTRVFADPKDTNTVYVLNVSFHRSTDGGKTFKSVPTPHGDNHDLWIPPDDPNRMIEGNDGGANVSRNRGKTWTNQAYATAQFYHVSTTNHFPYQVCGAQQDNSTVCGPSRKDQGIDIGDWREAGSGEAGYAVARPDQPDIVYAGNYGGLLTRRDLRTGLARNISPWPINPMGHSAGDLQYRFQWTFPIVISPHDPNTLYAGANVVFRSRNDGQSWEVISPDLTRHDLATLGPSGGPITKDQTSVEYYATVFTIAESPREKDLIWAGSDDGLVHVTRDGGKTWKDVTPTGVEKWTRISMIEASPHRPGSAFVAANRYQLDDLHPYIYRTDDYGATWRRIDEGIPPVEFVRVVREDPVRADLLFAGTERSVWVSFDGGGHWRSLRRNLPLVAIHDLAVKEGDLVAATHGRSFWILDDLSPLRQYSPDSLERAARLYAPRDPYRIVWRNQRASGGRPLGQNPPSGAAIYYWLKTARDTVTMDLLDSTGQAIRHFTSEPDSLTLADSLKSKAKTDSLARLGVAPPSVSADSASAEEEPGGEGEEERDVPKRARPPRVPNQQGLNRLVWDLRAADATDFDGMVMWAAATRGPVVPPGRYAVRMTVGKDVQTQPFTVLKDPRTTATPAQLAAQYAFLMQVRDKVSAANDAVRTIRNVRGQLLERKGAGGSGREPAGAGGRSRGQSGALLHVGDQLLGQLGTIEANIYQVKNRSSQDPLNYPIRLNNQIAALSGVAASTEAEPTDQTRAAFDQLSKALDVELRKLETLLARGLPPVNAELAKRGLPAIVPSTAELPHNEVGSE